MTPPFPLFNLYAFGRSRATLLTVTPCREQHQTCSSRSSIKNKTVSTQRKWEHWVQLESKESKRWAVNYNYTLPADQWQVWNSFHLPPARATSSQESQAIHERTAQASRPSLQGATRRHQIAPRLPPSSWALHPPSLIVLYCTGLINQIWSCKCVCTLLFWLVFNFTLFVHSKKGNVILCYFNCLCKLLIQFVFSLCLCLCLKFQLCLDISKVICI